ncbi:MAG: heme lyase CcmF/NrfE family subunit [Thermodesulfobacteriota bacterium]
MVEIGYLSLILALLFTAYSGLLSIIGVKGQREELVASSENGVIAVWGFLTVASVAMIYALISRDFQVEYVAQYTNRALPLAYTLAAFYAGQEGSLLLWAWLLSLFSSFVIWQNRVKNRDFLPHVMLVLMAITFFFLLLLVFVTNPFERLPSAPPDGQGLNPLLQNPGMIFHPTTLFVGYVGFAVPYAFAMAALITGQLGEAWIKTTRRWTLISWFFLTIGNLFGAQWAYVELGWGGYWAWDPVENASFLPWLVATAYLHSVMIQEKRGMLKVWNIVLITFTFLLTIFGTFITRSGIISSVHSFGQSSLGWIFLVFLGIVILASFNLLMNRLPQLKSRNELDSLLSRESSFLYNNLILVGIAFATFWGTIFPIISEAVRGVKITVGPPFFNKVNTPIGLALLALTGLCPLIAWRKASAENLRRNFFLPFLVAIAGGIVIYLSGIRQLYPFLSFTISLFVVFTIFLDFYRGGRARKAMKGGSFPVALWALVTRNKRRYGGYVVHLGIVLVFFGITGNAFKMEKQITVNKGDSFKVKHYTIRYDSLSQYPTANKEVVMASLSVFNAGKRVALLNPEKNFHRGQDQPTTEVAIHSTLKEDLYVILAGYEGEIATFKVLVNPLVVWLWIGGGVMALGTILVLFPDRRREKKIPAQKIDTEEKSR